MTNTINKDKIEIRNGYVILFDYVGHKASKEYRKKLFKGVTGKVGTVPEMPVLNTDDAEESLVLNMVKELNIDNSKTEFNQEFLDRMEESDVQKILNRIYEIKSEKEESKKK